MSFIFLKITYDSREKKVFVILLHVHILPLHDAYAHTDLMNINPNLFLALSAVGCSRMWCCMLPFVILIISPYTSSLSTPSLTFSAAFLVIFAPRVCCCSHIIKLWTGIIGLKLRCVCVCVNVYICMYIDSFFSRYLSMLGLIKWKRGHTYTRKRQINCS